MKNLKKLDRNELKTINGSGLLDDLLGTVSGAVTTVVGIVGITVCNVQCMVNGIIQIKLLPCGSTC
ncbi:bacteriocin-like protein [Chryseobacterium sp. MMS23-Vi53]|uniref:bacteriocin-like protein n=1 Tax=Chryseobacterium sp. MMS23-Vi53 TaxID=3386644 RepID=UPI0039EAE8FE